MEMKSTFVLYSVDIVQKFKAAIISPKANEQDALNTFAR